jgi:predicted nucleic acid-binding protein
MMRVFFDSSAFAKRYVREDGSDEVLLWCDRATELGLAVIAVPEIVSAFCRLQREGRVTGDQYRRLKSMLFEDVEDIALCDLLPEVIQQAVWNLEAQALRGMDAIHVGCALVWRADLFVSADRRQCTAARAAGLRVIEL